MTVKYMAISQWERECTYTPSTHGHMHTKKTVMMRESRANRMQEKKTVVTFKDA